MPALKDKYTAEVAPALMSKFGYTSPMEIPKLVKVIVNCGVGEAKENTKVLDSVVAVSCDVLARTTDEVGSEWNLRE